jgi:SAM-dependent MidA family methyltransferase
VSLRQQIEQEIRQRGPIPFSRYMQLCLYHPSHGYYSANAAQFGKAGDFYTSSDVHPVFGRLLARQFNEIWQAFDRPTAIEILELGPGRGLFARDVLDWSRNQFPDFFAALTYTLQESSLALRVELQETLREHLDSGRSHVGTAAPSCPVESSSADAPVWGRASSPVWGRASSPVQAEHSSASVGVDRALAPDTPLIVFANEFFDALPFEILSPQGKLHLAFDDNRLRETWLPPLPEELAFLDHYGVHPEKEERIEVPLQSQHWMNKIARSIEQGVLVVIDYGYTRNQQLAGRHRGTLMAYRQHSSSPDPYQTPGEQDLTAHVNFTALAAACEQEGMHVEKLRTQAQFLMGLGESTQFADAFEGCRNPQDRAKTALQLKHLVTPLGMGETFQVMIASREIAREKVAALSGLTFGRSS